ncbi:MAG: hypothetical protein BJ554DRAFT_41, partial [Olpidium bornovanus]
ASVAKALPRGQQDAHGGREAGQDCAVQPKRGVHTNNVLKLVEDKTRAPGGKEKIAKSTPALLRTPHTSQNTARARVPGGQGGKSREACASSPVWYQLVRELDLERRNPQAVDQVAAQRLAARVVAAAAPSRPRHVRQVHAAVQFHGVARAKPHPVVEPDGSGAPGGGTGGHLRNSAKVEVARSGGGCSCPTLCQPGEDSHVVLVYDGLVGRAAVRRNGEIQRALAAAAAAGGVPRHDDGCAVKCLGSRAHDGLVTPHAHHLLVPHQRVAAADAAPQAHGAAGSVIAAAAVFLPPPPSLLEWPGGVGPQVVDELAPVRLDDEPLQMVPVPVQQPGDEGRVALGTAAAAAAVAEPEDEPVERVPQLLRRRQGREPVARYAHGVGRVRDLRGLVGERLPPHDVHQLRRLLPPGPAGFRLAAEARARLAARRPREADLVNGREEGDEGDAGHRRQQPRRPACPRPATTTSQRLHRSATRPASVDHDRDWKAGQSVVLHCAAGRVILDPPPRMI